MISDYIVVIKDSSMAGGGVWVNSTRTELVEQRASRTLCVGLYILSSASFVSGSIHTPQSEHR